MYRGVSLQNDSVTFRDKDAAAVRKLAETKEIPECYARKVDTSKVNLDSVRPWTNERLIELTGIEDDVMAEYIISMLEDAEDKKPDPRKLHVALHGFLGDKTRTFMQALWELLLESQDAPGGIAPSLVEAKKEELRAAAEKNRSLLGSIRPDPSSTNPDRRDDWRSNTRSRSQFEHNGPRHGRRGEGRPRSRFDRDQFTDKNGNVTTRTSDSGWGARASRSSDPPLPRYRRDREDQLQPSRSRSRWGGTRRESSRHSPLPIEYEDELTSLRENCRSSRHKYSDERGSSRQSYRRRSPSPAQSSDRTRRLGSPTGGPSYNYSHARRRSSTSEYPARNASTPDNHARQSRSPTPVYDRHR